jgi:hypothetical protein
MVGNSIVIEPSAPLTSNTQYEVSGESSPRDPEQFVVRFRTGNAPDDEAPPAPTLTEVKSEVGTDEWGDWEWLVLVTDTATSSNDLYLEAQISKSDEFIDATTMSATGYHTVQFGTGPCGGNFSAIGKGDYFVRIRAVDWAGNTSAWATHDSQVSTRGCAAASRAWWGILVLLPWLVHRFRRRNSTAVHAPE